MGSSTGDMAVAGQPEDVELTDEEAFLAGELGIAEPSDEDE
ncbi:hypothetical protein QOM21_01365 [Streptomyces sp. Pv4-95]